MRRQDFVDPIAQAQDLAPLHFRVRLCNPRLLGQTLDVIAVMETCLAGITGAGQRRRTGRMRRAGQRNMPFAGEQPGGRIKTDPARAGDEHLGPGVQIGKVLDRPFGSFEGLLIGCELHQVTRDKTRRQSDLAQQLDQQPRGVATGTAAQTQRLFAALHAGLEAHHVFDVLLQSLIEVDQEIDDMTGLSWHALQPGA